MSRFLRQDFEDNEVGERLVSPDTQTLRLRGPYRTDRGGQHSSPALLSFTAANNQCSPAALGARPCKNPQADNEYHTVVTTCTFMERGGRTVLTWRVTEYDGASSINQTIKERAAKHLCNLWWQHWVIYEHYWKRAVFKFNVFSAKSQEDCRKTTFQNKPRHLDTIHYSCVTPDLHNFAELNKPHAINE